MNDIGRNFKKKSEEIKPKYIVEKNDFSSLYKNSESTTNRQVFNKYRKEISLPYTRSDLLAVVTDILPNIDIAYNLGSASFSWQGVYSQHYYDNSGSELLTFKTIVSPTGGNIVADSLVDTLSLSSSNSSVTITNTPSTDSIDFIVNPSAFVGGANTNIQFNDSGVFGGNNTFVFNKTNVSVGIGVSTPTIGGIEVTSGSQFTSIPANTSAIGIIDSSTGWYGNGFLFSNTANNAFGMVFSGDIAYFGKVTNSAQVPYFVLDNFNRGAGVGYLGSTPYQGLVVKGDVGVGTASPSEKLHTVGNVFIDTDSNKLLLGAGKDAGIYYDGTNMIIDPKLVGTGYLNVKGKLVIDTEANIVGDLNHDGTNIGFFSTAPTTKQTALTTQLTTITYTAPSTPDYALQDVTNIAPYGFANAEELRTFIAVVKNLQDRVAELETKLQAYGLLA